MTTPSPNSVKADKRRLSIVDDIAIASPCEADWESMSGDDQVRFCGGCRKNVYNLSEMPRGDAERLLEEREGSVCVRLYRRKDGTVITQDCPVGVRRARARKLALAALGGSFLIAAGVLLSAFTREPNCPTRKASGPQIHETKMGDVAPTIMGTVAPPIMGSVAAPPPSTPPRK